MFKIEFHFCKTNNAISLPYVYVHISTCVYICALLYEHRGKYWKTQFKLLPGESCLEKEADVRWSHEGEGEQDYKTKQEIQHSWFDILVHLIINVYLCIRNFKNKIFLKRKKNNWWLGLLKTLQIQHNCQDRPMLVRVASPWYSVVQLHHWWFCPSDKINHLTIVASLKPQAHQRTLY